jgi:excisionase family DNA binding protein
MSAATSDRKQLLKTADVADHLGVTSGTVRQWVKEGVFPRPIRGVRHWFFHPSAVEQFLAQALAQTSAQEASR